MDNAAGVEQPKRIVVIFYVLAALAIGVFLEKVIGKVMAGLSWNDPVVVPGFGYSLSTALGYGLAAIAAVVLWRIPKTQSVSMEIALELRRVTWPTMRETRAATIAVIVASFIAAIILGVFDWVWGTASNALLH
ncbi:MAG: preprotein translocase subunit SecE [Anaeromyxobacter sp.]